MVQELYRQFLGRNTSQTDRAATDTQGESQSSASSVGRLSPGRAINIYFRSTMLLLLSLAVLLSSEAGCRQYFDLTHTFDKDAPTWKMPDAKDKNYFKKTQLLNKQFPTYTYVFTSGV